MGTIQKDLADILSQDKSDITFHHGASSFISFAVKEKFNLLNQEIMVLVQKGFFYLIAFTNQELSLFNKFENLRNEGSGSANGGAPGTIPSGRYIPDVEDDLEDLGPADHQGYS